MAKRDYELKQAEYDKEVNGKKATADLAYALQVRLRLGSGRTYRQLAGCEDTTANQGGGDGSEGGRAHATDRTAATGHIQSSCTFGTHLA